MTDTLKKLLLRSLRDALSADVPDVSSGVGGGVDRVYFSLSPVGGQGVLLRISALGQVDEEKEGWQQSLGEVFSEAILLVSEVMKLAGLSFQTDEGDVTRIAARRGRYVSSTAFGEAVWLRAANAASSEGMREASQEEILLHTDDLPRFFAAVEKAFLPKNGGQEADSALSSAPSERQ